MRLRPIYFFALLVFPFVSQAQTAEGVPVVKIVRDESSVKFVALGVHTS